MIENGDRSNDSIKSPSEVQTNQSRHYSASDYYNVLVELLDKSLKDGNYEEVQHLRNAIKNVQPD